MSEFDIREDIHELEALQFKIDNLMSLDNMTNPDSVKVLQENLNTYVIGAPQLELDGIIGNNTLTAIRKYQKEREHWTGEKVSNINPLETAKLYQANKKGDFKSVERTSDRMNNNIAKINIKRDVMFDSNATIDIKRKT